jgi:hypothetical protein
VSCSTPAIDITYHCDMWTFLGISLPNLFADDLACVMDGRLGIEYSLQYLDLENKLTTLFNYLDSFAILSLQSIQYEKAELIWSSCAVGNPSFVKISMGVHEIRWLNSSSYLGYYLTSKLGFGTMIKEYKRRFRRRVAIAKSGTLVGTLSREFRGIIFNSYVISLFTCIFSMFSLFTNYQRDNLGHFYYTC